MINRLRRRTASFKAIVFVMGFSIIPFVIVLFCIILTMSNKTEESLEITRIVKEEKKPTHSQHIQFVETPKDITELNEDGSANGLNLLLIGQLNDGYIKDYLTILKDNQEGKLLPGMSHYATLERALGIVSSEQGFYPGSGGVLPVSTIGLDSSSNGPFYKLDSNPSNAYTLYTITSSDYNSGKVPKYDAAAVTSNETGTYVGPFQSMLSAWTNGLYKSSNLNGHGHSDGRNPDMLYFPDQVVAIDCEYSEVDNKYGNSVDLSSLTDYAYDYLLTTSYAGEDPYMNGAWISGDKEGNTARINKLAETMKSIVDKYGTKLSNYSQAYGSEFKWYALCMFLENGFSISNQCLNYCSNSQNLSNIQIAMNEIGIQGDPSSFLSSHLDSSISNVAGITGLVKCGDYSTTLEMSAHFLSEMMSGPVIYARMLQAGGVAGVDPTNPSSYMNIIKKENPNGYAPTESQDWYSEAGIDTSKLNAKRAALINEGHKILGVNYVWGGTTWPNQNSDGSYDLASGALDCSGFTMNLYSRVLNVDIGRTTYTQMASPLLEKVLPQEAKPGDLLFNDSCGHVLIYLSGDITQGAICMHSPQTGDVVKVGMYHPVWGGNIYRLKGIDD